METIHLEIAAEAVLLGLLAFSSAAEAAILSCNRLRARHHADQGNKGAKGVAFLHLNREDFLPSILALETLLTVSLSSLGAAIAHHIYPGGESFLVSAIAVTILVLFLGEIVPKTLATQSPDQFSYAVAPAIVFLTRFMSVWLHPFTWALKQILSLRGKDHAHHAPTEKELKYLITVSREHGIVEKEEAELLQNIFDFTDAKVGEIMIPRTQVASLEADSTLEELKSEYEKTGKSRYPVHSKDLDHVLGFVNVRDVFASIASGEKNLSFKTFIRPAVFIPESKRVGKLLQEMRKERFHAAIVVDEYGGTAGMVTLTDLLEAIVGELGERKSEEEIHPLDARTLIVPAATKLAELEERIGVSFEDKENQTVGGLVFSLFGRVPEEGERIRHQNVSFVVTEKDRYRIEKIMVTKEAL